MEVFPTDWSPRKTNLYLASGARDVLLFLDAADAVSDAALMLLLRSNWDISKFLFLLLPTNCCFSEDCLRLGSNYERIQ